MIGLDVPSRNDIEDLALRDTTADRPEPSFSNLVDYIDTFLRPGV